ncbi:MULTISPECIES: DUF5000 domain-containing lipoprotein [Pedobacter]|uniref:DUF4959 domain-containing protein n=1 Tax=Pedobacter heparinus (strain ATCC 13125 / DSM 2366 / CIP 104194 / JCM 7457 / NBRC 12017 / NCIMB 9290 / NRRL B-14731 / HIM 762-3) TaxID=485917 RepID=C6Y1F8_PEDHD|nr:MULTISPECIES: DUF5000 domain-containing lipoprotein [Pedobacter]ACU02934.1 hypothetical protein Phep_0712 [Pedobacter heparinus DSM 2366]MBB5438323.1 hypothetical protein [Pedobacter sp. AK017]
MKQFKTILTLFMLVSVVMSSCKEETLKPLYGEKGAPKPVTNASVENIAGGAIISYTLPDDANLLYVKAEYERQGKMVVSKSSFYKKSVLIEGLGDTNPREVKLYAVGTGEEASAPIKVTINPLAPPIFGVMQSLAIRESFGGMNVKFLNPASTGERPYNIVIGVVVWDDKLSEWKDVDAYYTGLASGGFSVRGLEAKPRKFGFFVKDTWDNRTDTLQKEMTPIYEEQLKAAVDVRKKFPIPQIRPLPVDGSLLAEPGNLSSWPFTNLFDNQIGNNGFHSNEKNPLPAWFPMDLGKVTRLSRYKIWQRMHDDNSTYFYSHGNPHEWEIWGTNTPADQNSWVMLDHQIMVKPSGLPVGQVSNDDVEIARAGHEYEFPLDAPAVRYIAWKHIDNWASIQGTLGFLHMSELRIWGQIQQ